MSCGTIYFVESRNGNVPLVISFDIKSGPITNKHAMHLGVNLLTEIFQDTYTYTSPPATSRPSYCTYRRPLREHLYMANQIRIHRGRGTAYISLNTRRRAKRGRRKRWREEEKKEKKRKVRVYKGAARGD